MFENKIIKCLKNIKTTSNKLELICETGLLFDKSQPYGEYNKYMLNYDYNLTKPFNPMPKRFPNSNLLQHWHGRFGFWQNPKELVDLIEILMGFDIKTFINIGSFNGWTAALINACLNPLISISLDINGNFLDPSLIDKMSFLNLDSNFFKNQQFDLCFIDGDHSYDWAKRDFENVGVHSKICVFHDICFEEGIGIFFNEIKDNYKNLLIKYNNTNEPSVFGIGVLWI